MVCLWLVGHIKTYKYTSMNYLLTKTRCNNIIKLLNIMDNHNYYNFFTIMIMEINNIIYLKRFKRILLGEYE